MMNRAVWTVILLTRLTYAQDSEEIAVRSVVAALGKALARSDAHAFSALFATDGDFWVGARRAVGTKDIERQIQKPAPMSEVSAPYLETDSVRFLSRDIALVDANLTRFGSLTIRERMPAMMVLKREQGAWRGVSMRIVTWPCLPMHPEPLR